MHVSPARGTHGCRGDTLPPPSQTAKSDGIAANTGPQSHPVTSSHGHRELPHPRAKGQPAVGCARRHPLPAGARDRLTPTVLRMNLDGSPMLARTVGRMYARYFGSIWPSVLCWDRHHAHAHTTHTTHAHGTTHRLPAHRGAQAEPQERQRGSRLLTHVWYPYMRTLISFFNCRPAADRILGPSAFISARMYAQ